MTEKSAEVAISGQAATPKAQLHFAQSSPLERWLSEGRIRHQQNKLTAAAECYRQALTISPNSAPAIHLLGVVALQQGNFKEAIERLNRACELDPNVAGYHRNLAEAFQADGDLHAALRSMEQAIRLEPTHPGAWVGMSETLWLLEELTPALDCLKQALQLDPNFLPARLLLANSQKQIGDDASALSNYRFVLEHDPDNLTANVNLAGLLRANGEINQALRLLQKVVDTGKASSLVLYNFANALVDAGKFEKAKTHYIAALPHHPRPAKVLFNLSSTMKFTAESREQLGEWEKIARSRMNTEEDHQFLHFALGKAQDDLGNFENAFEHYRLGNQLAPVSFDPQSHRQEIQEIIQQWSQEFIESRAKWGDETTAPIFIVGMPRSGTTLVEQILAAHSQVLSLGERRVMGQLIADYEFSIGCENHPSQAASLTTEADFHQLGQKALEGVNLTGNQIRFTDKMPTNFLLLGWIATCFPRATILHMRRDPRDVCLSCYFQNFTEQQPFAFDLDHLVDWHRDYQHLMQHWQKVLPGRIVDVKYEELVSDPEGQGKKIVQHCGLNWEPACLQPYAINRTVQTASGWQVRQPIYTTSCQRWKNYREQIPTLLQAFGEGDEVM